MLEFSDLPYQFIPPKPNNFIIHLGGIVNRFIGLKSKNHRLKAINLDGLTEFQKIAKEKDDKKVTKKSSMDIEELEWKKLGMEAKQEEIAVELRGLVLQMEVLTGRIRRISREMGASW